jgi:hypothetical protein
MAQTVMSRLLNAAPLANMPWEERPAGSSAAVWRSRRNPIIPHDLIDFVKAHPLSS